MLEEKTHLPAVLQSLGCIAQTAMPVFETRESEIEEFIKSKILRCSEVSLWYILFFNYFLCDSFHAKPSSLLQKADGSAKEWDDKSELCMLKVVCVCVDKGFFVFIIFSTMDRSRSHIGMWLVNGYLPIDYMICKVNSRLCNLVGF